MSQKPVLKNAALESSSLTVNDRINALGRVLETGSSQQRRRARREIKALIATSPTLRNRANDLGRELEAGRITPQQYDRRYAHLLGIKLPSPNMSSRFNRLRRNAISRHSVPGGLPSLGKSR